MVLLQRSFFARDTVLVAQELIGCVFVRKPFGDDGPIIAVRLTETEAYRGTDDPASHAYRGRTPRNAPMFGAAGQLYVYFIYGMHCCVNVVTGESGIPGAVLLRGAEPVSGLDQIHANRPGVSDKILLNGPGKLTKGLGIAMAHNEYKLPFSGSGEIELHAPDTPPPPFRCTSRIGISRGQELLWRFVADGPASQAAANKSVPPFISS
ncbi:DNA-3-methyladenine glycosylase [Gorillibacterium massiliense]|uniref:DNA-3-methyladenine glycosylase n=1 Tax=Gorillibacterium massiliense TaxID=1280390 RepID=UPI0004B32473|nr:DNA-3-methyladenine glycosylase [Gorillibacterium massiliense]